MWSPRRWLQPDPGGVLETEFHHGAGPTSARGVGPLLLGCLGLEAVDGTFQVRWLQCGQGQFPVLCRLGSAYLQGPTVTAARGVAPTARDPGRPPVAFTTKRLNDLSKVPHRKSQSQDLNPHHPAPLCYGFTV